ncbi:MAG: SIS domain-containing protein [Chloroflexi bacterium]|nr:SIS domain-containing protein [Chloroflexota bacterium]
MQSIDARDAGAAAVDYLSSLRETLALVPSHALSQAVECVLAARELGRRVYVFGNGGSAATASHFVCDLVKTAAVPGFRPLRAFSLTDNTPLTTAIANDCAYDETFSRLVETYVEPDDVVIAISASGNSPNVVRGLVAAREQGATTIALLGFDGGEAQRYADIALHVPCRHYGLAEDAHAAIGHAITAAVRAALESERSDMLVRLAGDVAAAVQARTEG